MLAVLYLVYVVIRTCRSGMGFHYFERPSFYPRRPVTLIPMMATVEAMRAGESFRVLRDSVINVFMLAPPSLAITLVVGRRWKLVLGSLAALSTLIEVFQYVAVVDRRASVDDILLNVVGVVVGIVAGLRVLHLLDEGDRASRQGDHPDV